MKSVKILGLLAVAAVAMMALAASASATIVSTTTGGAAATPTIHAVSEGGHVTLITNGIPPEISCASTVEGKVENHGGEGVLASGNISTLTFTNCTDSVHVTVTAPGSLSIKHTSGHNGDLYSTGAAVSTTRNGVTCNYETSNTTIGTITGGNPATLDIKASIPIAAGSSGLCGSGSAKWEGSYVVRSVHSTAATNNVTTSTGGAAATPAISALNEGGHVKLANNIAKIECGSSGQVKVEGHGEGVEVKGSISKLEWSSCTNGWHVTVNKSGSLALKYTSGHNGSLTSTGANVTATRAGVTCNYETSNTTIGTITGGNPATFHIEASIPLAAGSSFLCGSGSAKWEGSYVAGSVSFTSPETSVATTTGGESATPTIHAVNEGGHVILANSIANIECASTAEGTVESHGPGKTTGGALGALTFTGCTNSWHVTTEVAGSLDIDWIGGHKGVATSTGALVKATRFGVSCNYESNAKIGTLTGGNPATLHIEASIPVAAGSSFLCGSGSAKWEGSYTTTSPLYIDGQDAPSESPLYVQGQAASVTKAGVYIAP